MGGIEGGARAGSDEVRAWVAAANMGLGHKRAIQPLRGIAEGGLIVVNDASVAKPDELKLWDQLLSVYERLSRAKSIPLVGNALFGIMDYFQKIKPAYPRIDLSRPTVQTRWNEGMLDKGVCRGLIERIRTKPLPLVDRAGYGRVYCIICDADINRVWVTSNPRDSRIEYLVPCGSAMRRLKQYGVPDERIFMTGFPLPLELLGDRGLDVLKRDLGQRLRHLDPNDRFWPLHDKSVEHFLGAANCEPRRDRALTLAFCVGGAGAQKEIAAEALASLKPRILAGELRMNLVCGVRAEVRSFFEETVKGLGLEGEKGVLLRGPRHPDHHGSLGRLAGDLQPALARGDPGGPAPGRAALRLRVDLRTPRAGPLRRGRLERLPQGPQVRHLQDPRDHPDGHDVPLGRPLDEIG
jgi:hypothetical protein